MVPRAGGEEMGLVGEGPGFELEFVIIEFKVTVTVLVWLQDSVRTVSLTLS